MKRRRVFKIIQAGYMEDKPSIIYDFTLMGAILINLFIAVFDTFPESAQYQTMIQWTETVTVLFLTVDYILRIWTADFNYEQKYPLGKARVKFIFSLSGIIDFMSSIPYFLPFSGDILRIFRIMRIMRVFRVHRYADPLHVITGVLLRKKGQLLSSTFIVLVLIVASSLLMYTLEHEAQPETFANAFSGLWWAVNTLLTVGYGDVVPITFTGKICGTILTFLGVGMVAIPTGILSAGFMEEVSALKREQELEELKHILTLAEANAAARKDTSQQKIITDQFSVGGAVQDSLLFTGESDGHDPDSYSYCPYCGRKLP